jgi:uncharacterized membrane protein
VEHFYLFFLTTIAIVIAPGADTVLVTKNTLPSTAAQQENSCFYRGFYPICLTLKRLFSISPLFRSLSFRAKTLSFRASYLDSHLFC